MLPSTRTEPPRVASITPPCAAALQIDDEISYSGPPTRRAGVAQGGQRKFMLLPTQTFIEVAFVAHPMSVTATGGAGRNR